MSDKEKKEKNISARKALMKMMLENDKASKSSDVRNKDRKKEIAHEQHEAPEKKDKKKPKGEHVLITEMKQVVPDLKHGITSEYKKIKSLFKKKK